MEGADVARPRRRLYVELDADIEERQTAFEQEMNAGHHPFIRDTLILEHLDFMEHRIAAE